MSDPLRSWVLPGIIGFIVTGGLLLHVIPLMLRAKIEPAPRPLVYSQPRVDPTARSPGNLDFAPGAKLTPSARVVGRFGTQITTGSIRQNERRNVPRVIDPESRSADTAMEPGSRATPRKPGPSRGKRQGTDINVTPGMNLLGAPGRTAIKTRGAPLDHPQPNVSDPASVPAPVAPPDSHLQPHPILSSEPAPEAEVSARGSDRIRKSSPMIVGGPSEDRDRTDLRTDLGPEPEPKSSGNLKTGPADRTSPTQAAAEPPSRLAANSLPKRNAVAAPRVSAPASSPSPYAPKVENKPSAHDTTEPPNNSEHASTSNPKVSQPAAESSSEPVRPETLQPEALSPKTSQPAAAPVSLEPEPPQDVVSDYVFAPNRDTEIQPPPLPTRPPPDSRSVRRNTYRTRVRRRRPLVRRWRKRRVPRRSSEKAANVPAWLFTDKNPDWVVRALGLDGHRLGAARVMIDPPTTAPLSEGNLPPTSGLPASEVVRGRDWSTTVTTPRPKPSENDRGERTSVGSQPTMSSSARPETPPTDGPKK
ncbi:MAG: hypothetical protein AAF732_13860 [Pseudomonadota bacterium]